MESRGSSRFETRISKRISKVLQSAMSVTTRISKILFNCFPTSIYKAPTGSAPFNLFAFFNSMTSTQITRNLLNLFTSLAINQFERLVTTRIRSYHFNFHFHSIAIFVDVNSRLDSPPNNRSTHDRRDFFRFCLLRMISFSLSSAIFKARRVENKVGAMS